MLENTHKTPKSSSTQNNVVYARRRLGWTVGKPFVEHCTRPECPHRSAEETSFHLATHVTRPSELSPSCWHPDRSLPEGCMRQGQAPSKSIQGWGEGKSRHCVMHGGKAQTCSSARVSRTHKFLPSVIRGQSLACGFMVPGDADGISKIVRIRRHLEDAATLGENVKKVTTREHSKRTAHLDTRTCFS